MIPLSYTDLQIIIAAGVFLLGCLSVVIGVLILLSRSYSKELQTIAAHTARLGQKGMSHEISGLVQSAAELTSSINQLVRTANGIGVFLISLGMIMIAASYWLIQQIEWNLG
jgi:hypothetical protein